MIKQWLNSIGRIFRRAEFRAHDLPCEEEKRLRERRVEIEDLEKRRNLLAEFGAYNSERLERLMKANPEMYRVAGEGHAGNSELRKMEAYCRAEEAGIRCALARAKQLPEDVCLDLEKLRALYERRSDHICFFAALETVERKGREPRPDDNPADVQKALNRVEREIMLLEADLLPRVHPRS